MESNYIGFYISSHGFGHLTRCLALIEHILNTTNFNIYICSNDSQIKFAQIYLEKYTGSIICSVQKTDVGLINKENSLEVDVQKTNQKVKELLAGYETAVNQEVDRLKPLNPKLIISDISALGFLVSKKLNVNIVGIANFTWIDQYISVGLDTEIISHLKNIYASGTAFVRYDLSLEFKGAPKNKIIDTGFLVSRPIEKKRILEIKNECQKLFTKVTNKKTIPEILYISLGMSAQLPKISIDNFEGVIIYTEGVNISRKQEGKTLALLKLPLEIKDSQSYIATADYVIAKAGWSTTSESLVGHAKLTLINREGVDDDMNTINMLKSRKLVNLINATELIHLDYEKLKQSANQNIDTDKLDNIKNSTNKVCDLLLSFIYDNYSFNC